MALFYGFKVVKQYMALESFTVKQPVYCILVRKDANFRFSLHPDQFERSSEPY
jgi:hypothetical protein